jgi:uncharacterized peroxidase-related enzyme
MTTFTAYSIETAQPELKPILQDIEKKFGFVPNLFTYMAEAPVVIEAYLALNALIAKSSFTQQEAQVALLAVSVENQCGFCSVAHRAIGKAVGANQQTLDALNNNTAIENIKDHALATFVRAVVKERGWVADFVVDQFLASGFTKQQVFEVMLIVAIKTLSNYSNHISQTQPNPELLAML